MAEFDTVETGSRVHSRIMKSVVSPRPIAWISTVDDEGVDNLAPFSSYNYLGHSPPMVQFNSRNESAGELKDTARNALDTGEFAVNVVTESMLETMDHTSKDIPAEESEFDLADVQRADCRHIDPLRVADAAATLECTVLESREIRNRLMIVGDVVYIHVDDERLTEGQVDALKMDTVGRLGGPFYTVSSPNEFERQY
jgi:flavin reductase (DIM6/NTAB) family NADH-FMN oxidoreductase RutF